MTNVSLKISTRECVPDNLFLGYEGENEINKLVFKFEDGFFDGSGLLNVQRGEQKGYVALNKVGETYELDVKNSLLSQKGDIKFQLSITSTSGAVIKFDPFAMIVKDSIDTDAELPEEYPDWITEANSKLAEIDKAIQDAEKLSAKVEQTEKGALITITDREGTTTAEVYHGTGEGTGGGGIVAETDPIYNKDKPNIALKSEIPTNLSQLTNDSGFITEEDIPEPPKVPTKTSELTNDSEFATETYVDEEIAKFDFIKVVDVLPEIGLPNRIYFVPKADTQTQDLFDEFAWINGTWEYITTKKIEVDLTTKQDTLVSGTNIKTINGESILGEGDITIEGGGSSSTKVTLWEGELTELNKAVILSDSVENYDFILVEAMVTGISKNAAIETKLIDVNTLIYTGSTSESEPSYNIFSSTGGVAANGGLSVYYRVLFAFLDATSLFLVNKSVGTTAWTNPRITKITGIKI